jgi:phage-related protein
MGECVTLVDEDEAEELETPVLRPLVWLGTSLRNLRAFPDEAKKGIATPKPDVDLIKQRYKEARELAEHEQDKR